MQSSNDVTQQQTAAAASSSNQQASAPTQKHESDFMGFVEDELKDINRSFQSGALNAFGQKEATILKQIDTIRWVVCPWTIWKIYYFKK